MVSVITLTYKRHKILEEAINSFILQSATDCEMIVINDAPETTYTLELSDEQQHKLDTHRNTIRIINEKTRYPSIMEKLRRGFDLAKHEYMYRLDDDDLLAKDALESVIPIIRDNPGYDIYRSRHAHHFTNNTYTQNVGCVNNGNIFTKKYIASINEWRNESFGEDTWIVFHAGGTIYTFDPELITMIYRWGPVGGPTYHISALGDIPQEEMFKNIDKRFTDGALKEMKEDGDIVLRPKFRDTYYKNIREGVERK